MGYISDDKITQDCYDKIDFLKKYLGIINGKYIAKHISGEIPHFWVTYRDPDRNWYSKTYKPVLNNETASIISKDDKGFYVICGLGIRDNYINDFLSKFRIECEGEFYDETKDLKTLKEYVQSWKQRIADEYDRENHIAGLINSILPDAPSTMRDPHTRRIHVEAIAYMELYKTESKEFECEGLFFEVTDTKRKEVRLKSMTGIFGQLVHYGKTTTKSNNQKVIIPQYVKSPTGMRYLVTELAKGLFDFNIDIHEIILPSSIKKAEWSFWHCKNLERINVKSEGLINSDDGVLFSGDRTTLIAYPNSHGKLYKVPKGVIEIGRFAFKDCDLIEEIHLPSSIKRIKVNAFYRCENLKKIICNCNEGDIDYEGFYGDYGNVEPIWEYRPKM